MATGQAKRKGWKSALDLHSRWAEDYAAWLSSDQKTKAPEEDCVQFQDVNLKDHDLTGRDLRWAHLSGIDLANSKLTSARLQGADLRAARMTGAKLAKADMQNAKLGGADLSNASLADAELAGADLSCADLRGADLAGADLSNAHMSDIKLAGADLSNAILRNANLSGADLSNADLRGADLSGADLSNADLSDAKLARANLSKADLNRSRLTRANLQDANLRDAKLSGADLSFAKFRDADLSNAVLEADGVSALGLSADSLGGSVLVGVKLPDNVKDFEGLTGVKEVSGQIQSLFKILVALCGFGVMATLSVTDEQLAVHGSAPSMDMPAIHANISPIMFIFVTPMIILFLQVYFYIYIFSLWKAQSMLPAIFPDGTTLDRRAYPLTLNPFIRIHFVRLADYAPNWFQMIVASMLVFMLAPLTLSCFWSTCLRRHQMGLSMIHSVLLAVSIGLSASFLVIARSVLREEWDDWSPLRFRQGTPWRSVQAWGGAIAISFACCYFFPHPAQAIMATGLALVLLAFIPNLPSDFRRPATIALTWFIAVPFFWNLSTNIQQIPDVPNYVINYLTMEEESAHAPASVAKAGAVRKPNASWLEKKFGGQPFLDLSDKDLSTKPTHWGSNVEDENHDVDAVIGVDMGRVDLRKAVAIRAFLVKANLRGALLNEAYLRGANLRSADLRDADLRGAFLPGTNLRNALLQMADLRGADFSGHMPNERMDDGGPNLQGAQLKGARYNPKDIRTARNVVLAYFGADDPNQEIPNPSYSSLGDRKLDAEEAPKIKAIELLKRAGVAWRSDEKIRNKDMDGYKFDGMDLRGADFSYFSLAGANFESADVRGASFQYADLREAKFNHAKILGADVRHADLRGSSINIECIKYLKCETKEVESVRSQSSNVRPGQEISGTAGKEETDR